MKPILCLIAYVSIGVCKLWCLEPAEFSALKAAAENGDREAMNRLAGIYSQAFVDIYDNHLTAAESKVGFAITEVNGNLGELYQLVDKWTDRAAELGHPEAMFSKAGNIRDVSDPELMAKRAELMKKSAEAGWAPAMMEMANSYAGGDDEVRADWLKRAAAGNHFEAFGELADAYLDGRGVPYNPKRAVELLTKGSQAPGDTDRNVQEASNCMFKLGRLYIDGKHVAKDEAVAARWLSQAAEAGNGRANLPLADLLIRGAGVSRDLAKARKLIESSAPAPDWEIKPLRAALAAAEKAEAENQAMRKQVADLAPVLEAGWAKRLLAPPAELAGLEPVDVYYMMTEKVAPPTGPNLSVDHSKFIPGTMSFSSMRLWLCANEVEFEKAYREHLARGGNPYPVRIRGSDLTGGRVMLGWTAWVCINDWWPEGYGYPNEGVGYCYGARSLDEALEVAYASALKGLRKRYQGPIRCIQIEAGISAKPKWDVFRANKSASAVIGLTYGFVFETPAKEKDAYQFGFKMTAPEDPKEFPRFARVTMRQRVYPQLYSSKDVAKDYPRAYGSYGLMNAPVLINPRPLVDFLREFGFAPRELIVSDEPPAFTVLPF